MFNEELSSLFDFGFSDVAKAAAQKLGLGSAEDLVSTAGKGIQSLKKGSPDKQTPAVLESNPIIEAGREANSPFGGLSIGGISPVLLIGVGVGAFFILRGLRR